MSARDEWPKLTHAHTGPHHQGQTSQEALAALDEIDRLRAEVARLAAERDAWARVAAKEARTVTLLCVERDALRQQLEDLADGCADALNDSALECGRLRAERDALRHQAAIGAWVEVERVRRGPWYDDYTRGYEAALEDALAAGAPVSGDPGVNR